MNTRWRLDKKIAVITGATKGIGRAVADEFLRFGAEVIAVARDGALLEKTVAEWKAQGYTATGIQSDVSKEKDRATLLQELSASGRGIDILVNNVGTNIRKPTTAYSYEEYRKVFSTNMDSTFELCRGTHALMQKRDGTIVNVLSVAGLLHIPTGSPYAMSKAALVQLTKNLAVEWAKDGIRVNAVAPWYTKTPLAEPVLQNEEYLSKVLSLTPLGRIAEPEEVASAVTYLCLPAASYVTGHCLTVDGGFTVSGFMQT